MAENVERKFLSIKVKTVKGKPHVLLSWREPGSGEDWVTRGMDNPAVATQEFYDRLDELQPHIKQWLASAMVSQDAETVTANVRVLGLSYQYSEQGDYHVSISSTVALPGFASPKVDNWPRLIPGEGLRKVIDNIEYEAVGYINGDRGQLEMELPGGEG